MPKLYLLIYSDLTGTRERIKQWADACPLVSTWRYDLPHCFYLVSTSTAAELSEDLRVKTGNAGRHLIIEASENRQGWLPADTWYFLRNKKAKPKA